MPDSPTTPWYKSRKLAYGVFFAVAFLFALVETFPFQALKERIVIEAARAGWQVQMAGLTSSGLGIKATGVVAESMKDGMRLSIDELRARPHLFAALFGQRAVSFEASLFDGKVKGEIHDSKTQQHVECKAEGLDLARAPALRKATGLELAGHVKADVDVTLDNKEPSKSTGQIQLTVEKAAINGGEVPVPGMGGNLSLPKMMLGNIEGKATIKDGKANVDKLEAKSEDLELSTEGLYVMLQTRLEFSPIFGKARFKLNDGFWNKSGTAAFRGVAEMALANAKSPSGFYTFQIQGNLANPSARPAAR